ncbi:hypothetical protein [Pseudomonas xionganensis]|uniref:Uncharacterized protein n=1 Tax=Pseudomonas xionganensis TaxID=2654845 RepID=A0A6I4KUJ3_9PSED|nr:hypothetical protein [Pseudomonas xionganensis]MVW75361.1 hypothetical protein [Pseudomonas xionganensis]
MNALQQASASVTELADLINLAGKAREAFAQRQQSPGRAAGSTRVIIKGRGMVQVVDAAGRCLGFRQSYREARWLQQALENGTHQQSA